jgi:hypothetical protein
MQAPLWQQIAQRRDCGGHVPRSGVKEGETARAWGYNPYGEVGDGTRTNRTSPVQPQLLVAKYYYFGAQRVAMRRNGVLQYIAGDHPSAASLTCAAGLPAVAGQAWAERAWC